MKEIDDLKRLTNPSDWLAQQGPWNLSDETVCEEFHRLMNCAKLLAGDADEARARRAALRRVFREFRRMLEES